jgi:radical SAM protein (TIGR01212 family)
MSSAIFKRREFDLKDKSLDKSNIFSRDNGESGNNTNFPWDHDRRYNDYPSFIRKKFGGRVQKLSVNAGFTCPNRDGSKDTKGCSYCNNTSFRPVYCEPEKSVTQQINEGINFFSGRYPDMKFMAYFQSFSNTYAEVDLLDKVYSEALANPKVIGLVIGTRPDCVNEQILDLVEEKKKHGFMTVEYGIESTLDFSLRRINRHHTWEETKKAIASTKKRDIHVGGHLIMGIPGESKEDMLSHAKRVSELGINTLKLHQLQIVKHTVFAKEYRKNQGQFELFEVEDYIDFCVDFLELLHPEITVERFVNQSPADMLIAPQWRLKNFEIVAKVEKRLRERNTWQGRLHYHEQ